MSNHTLSSMTADKVVEETKAGGKQAHGTANYPDPLIHIDKNVWDVVIIGSGPAGLMLASSLARFGGHDVLVVDERSEPTTAGRADGIQPRTIEVLRNMEPLGSEFVARSAASYERTFWDPRSDGIRGIERTRRVQSFPTNMEIQDNCTLGLQQGMIEGGYLRDMERHGQRVTRPWGFRDFKMTGDKDHPVSVTLEKMKPVLETTNDGGAPISVIKPTGELKTIRTKYLVGCDGGRSAVRKVMENRHGVEFNGDWVDTLWAALDCVVETDFPDVRKIAAIHSKNHGALYIFPRENNERGQPIIRCYTQVNRLQGEKSKESALEVRDKVTADMVMKAIREIAYPYQFDFKVIEWFTCYPIGQRLVSRYSLPAGQEDGVAFPGHHVFLAGDACHTHSPKAGQGMNTAIIDAQALAWRINLVEKGLADAETLLPTYHDERHATGKQLIEFDAEYSALFSGEIPKSQPEVANMTDEQKRHHFIEIQRRNAAFTTGAGVVYADNVLNHRDPRKLGVSKVSSSRLEPGVRLQPAWATRWVSSTPVRIIHEIQFTAPGGFRIYVLAGDLEKNMAKLRQLADHLSGPQSFLNRFRPNAKAHKLAEGAYHRKPEVLNTGLGQGLSEEANPFFHLLLIVKRNRFKLELEEIRELGPLRPMLYADDVEPCGERRSNEDGDEHVGGLHSKWGLEDGGIVVCRPDGYVGCVLPLDHQGGNGMEKYFDGFLRSSLGPARL
ncbi:FAD/NAD(P)-binding domain-containing protein [Violaceomyces palustris]|uniref:FAD/NAD(P)-binding domain-containing protein n=1 Tax=Violaceomyces palustris TaxID=1673888 RepID=A0ACD0P1Y1_9BASI|nr:FAD/NAD(P)-binding domain-containing protein [Violaceomyces palustris]